MPPPSSFAGSTKWTKRLLYKYLENDDLGGTRREGTVVHCRCCVWRQDVKASLLYRIAAILLLLFAVGRTLGFRQSDPTWGVDPPPIPEGACGFRDRASCPGVVVGPLHARRSGRLGCTKVSPLAPASTDPTLVCGLFYKE